MQGLYLLDNDRIASGEKTALATATPRDLCGARELIVKHNDGYVVVGQIELGAPETVSLKVFDGRLGEHCVTRVQRRRWWSEADELTLHPLTYSAYPREIPVEIAPGCGMCVELVGLGLKEIVIEDGCYIYEVE